MYMPKLNGIPLFDSLQVNNYLFKLRRGPIVVSNSVTLYPADQEIACSIILDVVERNFSFIS